jgi:hypothetical protein
VINNDHKFRDNNEDMIFSKRGESDGEPSPEDDCLSDDELDVLSGEYVQIEGETGTGEVDSTLIKSILEEA